MDKIKKEVEQLIAEKIRNIMNKINFPYIIAHDDEIFDKVQKLSALVTELLKDKEIKEKFEELANQSKVNGENNDVKLEVFTMLRNIILHFPFFDKWEDIYLNRKILNWNRNKKGSIEKFFDKNKNKKLKYTIYMKHENKWNPEHEVNIEIPNLDDNKKIYLKDIISIKDILWTFAIIDYYLDYIGYTLDTNCHLSI